RGRHDVRVQAGGVASGFRFSVLGWDDVVDRRHRVDDSPADDVVAPVRTARVQRGLFDTLHDLIGAQIWVLLLDERGQPGHVRRGETGPHDGFRLPLAAGLQLVDQTGPALTRVQRGEVLPRCGDVHPRPRDGELRRRALVVHRTHREHIVVEPG